MCGVRAASTLDDGIRRGALVSLSKQAPRSGGSGNSGFSSATWIMGSVDSCLCKILVSADRSTGYVLGKHLKSSRKGQEVMVSYLVQREEEDDDEEMSHFRKGVTVVVKAFSSEQEAQKEAILTRQACSGGGEGSHGSSGIVRLLDLIRDGQSFYIVQEFISGGDLCERMLSMGDKGAPMPLAKRWFSELLQGLVKLKRNRIAHMDISPEVRRKRNRRGFGGVCKGKRDDSRLMFPFPLVPNNFQNVLLDEGDHCKLIDFGMSILLPQGYEAKTVYEGLPCCGKDAYMAPEVYHRKPYDPCAADIWSLGIVFYVIATGMPLYAKAGDRAFCALEQGQFDRLVNHYHAMGCPVPEGPVRDLIREMLNPNPRRRPTVETLLERLPLFSTPPIPS